MDTSQQFAGMLAADEGKRISEINKAWNAYYGEMPKPLRVPAGKPDDNIRLPLPSLIVDKGRSFLFGAGVEFEVVENEPAQAWLDSVWDRNKKSRKLNALAQSGGIAGHAYAKIIEEPAGVRFVILDPANVRVRWAEDDIDTVTAYRIDVLTERDGKPLRKEQRIDRQDNGAWTITDWEASGDSPLRQVNEVVWRWPFAPVVDCQNLPAANSYYGISDIESGLLESMNGVNTILSNANKILRYHAHPKTIATGLRAKDLDVGSDGVLFIPPGGEIHNLEMQGDLGSSLALYQELMQVIFESARIPEVARGKLESIGNLSGVALRILYEPILEKTLDKRGLYGDLLTELNERLLYIGGYPSAEVELVWPEIVPTDPKSDAETALLWQQAGASQDTMLARAGFDADDEATKRTGEQGSMADAMLATFNAGPDISNG